MDANYLNPEINFNLLLTVIYVVMLCYVMLCYVMAYVMAMIKHCLIKKDRIAWALLHRERFSKFVIG